MNEKIKELVKTAVLAVDGCTGDEGKDEELSRMYIPDCFAEKFAELIIRECIQVCRCRAASNQDYNTGRMHCVSDIKDHFGIDK